MGIIYKTPRFGRKAGFTGALFCSRGSGSIVTLGAVRFAPTCQNSKGGNKEHSRDQHQCGADAQTLTRSPFCNLPA